MPRIFCDDDDAQLLCGPAFSPANLEGVVTSWFRLAQGTITGAGYSSIPDLLDAGNPLVQAADAQRPPGGTSSNGLPIIAAVDDFMPVAVTAARANVTTWGFWAWVRQGATANNMHSFRAANGASANRHTLFWQTTGTELVAEISAPGGSRFVGTTGHAAAAWHFITIEFNGNRAGDARCILTVDGVVPGTLGYATGTGIAEMPATMTAITGAGSMFALGAAGPFYVGDWGPNFGFLGGAMAGATEGLLTAAARTSLMNFERPA
jgi:hypothetical protein